MKRRFLHLIPLLGSGLVCFVLLFYVPRVGADGFFYSLLGISMLTALLSSALSFGIPPLKNVYLGLIGIDLAMFLFFDPTLWSEQAIGPVWILTGALALFNPDNRYKTVSSLLVFLVAFIMSFFPSVRFVAYAILALTGFVFAFLSKSEQPFSLYLSISLAFFNAALGFIPGKSGISYANLVPPIAVMFGFAYGLFRSLWKVKRANMEIARKETTLSHIEEKSLKEEIQPHFLLNALNNVRVAYHESKEKGMVQLGELRELEKRIYQTIDTSNIPLSEEIRIIESLILLHNTDRQADINLVLDIEDETLPIPPMLLEPLVENSLQHSGIMQQEGGEIRIKEREEYGVALILVSDNGQGIPLPSNSRGIGLSNVMKRVSLLENGHMSIDSDEGGTTIEIRFVPERGEQDFFAKFGEPTSEKA